MRPTYATLSGFNGSPFQLDNVHAASGGGTMNENTRCVSLAGTGGSLKVSQCAAGATDSGMWVCYAAKQATYGFAAAGQTWAASGPFSGCQLFLGTRGGRVFMAHISIESGSSAQDAWSKRGWNDATIWAQWKVSLPSQTFYSASHVFVDWSAGAAPQNIKVVRVDVKCTTMGGTDGDIFNVVNLAG